MLVTVLGVKQQKQQYQQSKKCKNKQKSLLLESSHKREKMFERDSFQIIKYFSKQRKYFHYKI